MKYYHNCLFYNVQHNFIMQTGDPTNTGRGGKSVYGVLYGEQARFFEDEIHPHLKHKKKGVLGMASEWATVRKTCTKALGSNPCMPCTHTWQELSLHRLLHP